MNIELYKNLENSFGVTSLEVKNRNQSYIRVKKEMAVPLITHLKLVESYKHLSFFTIIDQIEKGEFELLYMLHSYSRNHDLGIIVSIERHETDMESIHHLWPAAETYQRELREMFGVEFPDSPGLYENFCLEGWEGIPPMRREFDTKRYSEDTFYKRPGRETNDPAKYMKEKIYPSEAETW